MLQTRNSKRLAMAQNAGSAAKSKTSAKCDRTSLDANAKESKIKLQRNKKESNLREKRIKERDKVFNETSATKKNSFKGVNKSLVRLTEGKSKLQKLKNDESKKLKKTHKLKKNVKFNKENKLAENKLPLKKPSKTKNNNTGKVVNHIPLKTISDNAVCHVPIWAVDKNLCKKQAEKRLHSSDIYNIEKDEDLMSELSPVKKKMKITVKKPQAMKTKIFSKKIVSSHTSCKDKFLFGKAATPARQFTKCERLNSNKTELIKTKLGGPTLHTADKHRILRTVPALEHVDSVFESKSSNDMKNTDKPAVANKIGTDDNAKTEIKGKKVGVINMNTLQKSTTDCLGKSVNNCTIQNKQKKLPEDKINSYYEQCINECYNSFMNIGRIHKTPEKFPFLQRTNSGDVKTSNNSCDGQIFLIPKMTSTPETEDHPVIQPLKQLSKDCSLELSEMSSIPYTVSRNIQFELSGIEISPIKPASNDLKIPLLESPSKENKPENVICLSTETRSESDLKEKISMQVCEKNIPVKSSKLSKISAKKICTKTKDSCEDIEIILQKENSTAILPKPGYERKRHVSPLKSIQIVSVDKKISFNADENEGDLPVHRNDKNLDKTLQKQTQSKKIITKSAIDSYNKNSVEKDDLSFHSVILFESPQKEETSFEKSLNFPVKKVKKNIFPMETVSFATKDDHFFNVLKPVNCYQSKKVKSRAKETLNAQKKIKDNKETNNQLKKYVSRTKAASKGKQKEKRKDKEAEKVNQLIENLNQHFCELESMELCIE